MTTKGIYIDTELTPLPAPRLELRWEKESHSAWLCRYNIVIPLSSNDIRLEGFDAAGSEFRRQLSATRCERTTWDKEDSYPIRGGTIETPFRDGAHIAWDSFLMKLPAYVVRDHYAQFIEAHEAKEYPEEPKDAPKVVLPLKGLAQAARYKVDTARQVLRQVSSDIGEERRKTKRATLTHKFLGVLEETVDEIVKVLTEPYLPDPDGWFYNLDGQEEVLPGAKIVCATCGEDVPDDVREACVHILDDAMRAEISDPDED